MAQPPYPHGYPPQGQRPPPWQAKDPWYHNGWLWFAVIGSIFVLMAMIAIARLEGARNSASPPVSTQLSEPAPTDRSTSEPSSTPSATTSPAPPGVGSTLSFVDDLGNAGTVTLHGLRRITAGEGPIGGAAPTNGSYLVADVSVAITEGEGSAHPWLFRVQTPDGRTFDSELGIVAQQIDSSDIPAGRQVRGEVAFDAPVGELLLDYMEVLGGPLVTFHVNG